MKDETGQAEQSLSRPNSYWVEGMREGFEDGIAYVGALTKMDAEIKGVKKASSDLELLDEEDIIAQNKYCPGLFYNAATLVAITSLGSVRTAYACARVIEKKYNRELTKSQNAFDAFALNHKRLCEWLAEQKPWGERVD